MITDLNSSTQICFLIVGGMRSRASGVMTWGNTSIAFREFFSASADKTVSI